jgi:hypothetical protein
LTFVSLDETIQGTVICFFDIVREKTGRELLHAPVILDAFAAGSLPAAGLPSAVAALEILFALTFFHGRLRPEFRPHWLL